MFCQHNLGVHTYFSFSEFANIPGLLFVTTTRSEPQPGNLESDQLAVPPLLSELGIPQSSLVLLNQVHGSRISVVSKSPSHTAKNDSEPADGMIVDQPGFFGALHTADCVPIVAFEPGSKVISLIHAGWRGTAERIAEKGLQTLLEYSKADPTQVRVAFGPCIRSCCYEISGEVIDAFEASGQSGALMKNRRLDLIAANKEQLHSLGIRATADAGICTACRTDLFYSYRREKTDRRFWTIAGFRE
jgi:YfiH family protein